MEKFVISKNTNGEFKYEFLDQFGELIFEKSGYKTRTMCLKVIESIKNNAQDDSKFYRKRTADDQCYFNLKSSNGQIIAISKMYPDKASREEGIAFIKTKSISASIEDYSKKQNRTLEEIS